MPTVQLGPTTPAPPLKPQPAKAPNRPDIFATNLQQLEWRGAGFPASSVSLSFEQDLVEHKYVGVDGASVEATGRGAMRITAEIPFVNGIVPGKGENWVAGDLYPAAFRAFLRTFSDRSTGLLQHPELGLIYARPATYETKHDPMRRDGVIVSASWIETFPPGAKAALQIATGTGTSVAKQAALDLDASKTDVRALAADYVPPAFADTFDSSINKLVGQVDRITLGAALAANKPNQIVHRVKTLTDSVDRLHSPLTWPVTDAAETVKSAMLDVAHAATAGGRPVLRYTTKARATLASLTSVTGSSVDDLIRLNPQLLSRPEVPSGTVIRYYAP